MTGLLENPEDAADLAGIRWIWAAGRNAFDESPNLTAVFHLNVDITEAVTLRFMWRPAAHSLQRSMAKLWLRSTGRNLIVQMLQQNWLPGKTSLKSR